MKQVYMDHSATTATDPVVTQAMLPYFSEKYGNPSSLYTIGRQARRAIEEARQLVADLIGAKKEEIIFTGSRTESDNLAIKGYALKNIMPSLTPVNISKKTVSKLHIFL